MNVNSNFLQLINNNKTVLKYLLLQQIHFVARNVSALFASLA